MFTQKNRITGGTVVIAEEAAAVAEICKKRHCSFFQTAKNSDEALKLTAARCTALSAVAEQQKIL